MNIVYNFLFGWFFKQFSLTNEDEYLKFFQKVLNAALVIYIVTAIFSVGFHHFDEQWQILEFMGLKLGLTTKELLPWEYHFTMRSWSQPGLYLLLSKLFFLSDPFHMALLFRIFTALVGWYALGTLALAAHHLYKDKKDLKLSLLFLAFSWYIPYLKVRPSSEGLSTSVFIIGLSFLIAELYKIQDEKKKNLPLISAKNLFISGFICGLSFLFRYQLGFIIFFSWLWLVFFSGIEFKKTFLFALGVCFAVAIDLPLCYWGYEKLTFSPWHYFYQNLVLDKASNFPTMPWWWFFKSSFFKAVPPFSFILIATQVLFWIFRPKNLFTWATLPLFFIHAIIPAKALRYIFPIAVMTPILIPWAHNFLSERLSFYKNFSLKNWALKTGKILFFINGLILLYVALTPSNRAVELYKVIYKDETIRKIYHVGEAPFHMVGLELHFYRPKNLIQKELTQFSEVDSLNWNEGFWFVSKSGSEFSLLKERGCQPKYATYPNWLLNYNIGNWVKRTRIWSLFYCRQG